MIPDEIIVRHRDTDTICPEHSWPRIGSCDLIGTGAHANLPLFHDRSDVVEFFEGIIDIPHFAETGKIRRILPDRRDDLTFRSRIVTEVKDNRHTHGKGHVYCYECDRKSQS